MTDAPFFSRQERFRLVGSTNDVVRDWLAAGVPEVCLAVADEQSAGRGRAGRSWVAPADAALLLSLGFRPIWLEPDQVWQLAATASLALADAAEEVAGLPDRHIRLKWPNDLVVESGDPQTVRKLAGVLGETDGLGSADPRVVVGLGINADWERHAFPAEVAGGMTSLREASGGRPIDRALLLEAFLSRLEPRILALRSSRFDAGDWIERQITNGRLVRLEESRGGSEVVRAAGVDPDSGALLVEDVSHPHGERPVLSGEVVHVRLADEDAVTAEAGSPAVRSPGGV